jgi:hypothetical protein
MEVRNKNKSNKLICSKNATKKALLDNVCMESTQNAKKSIEKIDNLKKPKGNQ